MIPDDALARLRKKPNDPSAWEVIYKYMHLRLMAYVSSLLSTFSLSANEAAHDIVHEVVCIFWERWPSIRSTIPDSTAAYRYMKTISRNLLVDRYRHDQSAEPLLDFLTLQFTQISDPQKFIVRDILVGEVISSLPKDCACLFRAYVEDGLSLAEMADREGSAPAAFYSRWYRCIERAREQLKQSK